MVHVGKYTIHGCYGLGNISIFAIVLVKFTLYLLEMYGRKGRYIFQSHGAYTLENEHFEPENLSFEIGKSSEPILQI